MSTTAWVIVAILYLVIGVAALRASFAILRLLGAPVVEVVRREEWRLVPLLLVWPLILLWTLVRFVIRAIYVSVVGGGGEEDEDVTADGEPVRRRRALPPSTPKLPPGHRDLRPTGTHMCTMCHGWGVDASSGSGCVYCHAKGWIAHG
jgi:hypothetical protein